MSKQTDPDSHDSIEEAVAGFARMTVPERPPDQPLIEAISTCGRQSRAAARTPLVRTTVFERIKNMNPLVRYAAATLIVSVVGCVVFLLVGTDAEGIALAEVHQAVSKQKVVQFTEIEYLVEGDRIEGKVYLRLDLSRGRAECADGTIHIVASEKGNDTYLTLDPTRKTATIMIMPGTDGSTSLLEQLEEMRNKQETVTTREELDGKQTLVHRWIDKRKTAETIWVDPKSKLPVRIESVYASPQAGIKRSVTTDFVWNPKVEESFFSIKPPDGYKVTTERYYRADREASKSTGRERPQP